MEFSRLITLKFQMRWINEMSNNTMLIEEQLVDPNVPRT